MNKVKKTRKELEKELFEILYKTINFHLVDTYSLLNLSEEILSENSFNYKNSCLKAINTFPEIPNKFAELVYKILNNPDSTENILTIIKMNHENCYNLNSQDYENILINFK